MYRGLTILFDKNNNPELFAPSQNDDIRSMNMHANNSSMAA